MCKLVNHAWFRGTLVSLAVCIGLCRSAEAGSVTLAWDPVAAPSLQGYILYYATTSGAVSGVYTNSVDVGNVTQWTIPGLTDGVRYFFNVRAYDASGQSPFAPEVSGIVSSADLTVLSTHSGSFTQGQVGATYTLTVSNPGAGQVVGIVTVADTLPAGMTATAMTGTGWTCTVGTAPCTTSGVLAGGGASYPPITLTVNVSATAGASLTNSVTVSGGGDSNAANNTGTDPT